MRPCRKGESIMSKIWFNVILAAGLALPVYAAPKKVLVVTTTLGFRHSSIPTAEKIIGKLAKESGAFDVEYVQQPTEPKQPAKPKPEADEATKAAYQAEMEKYNAARKDFMGRMKQALSKLSPENLKNYDAVIFANTTGDLPLPDPQGFLDWIKAGHGFVGMHSASDTFHGFRPYIDMIGGEFQSHGAQVGVDAINEDKTCPACKHLGDTWGVFDEIYLFKNFTRDNVHALLSLDKEPNKKTPGYYPVSWIKKYGQGRVFYTSLGHREDVWDDDPNMKGRKNPPEVSKAYQQHILAGIKWAVGLETMDATPQKQQ